MNQPSNLIYSPVDCIRAIVRYGLRKSQNIQLAADRLKIITHLMSQAAHEVAHLSRVSKYSLRCQLLDIDGPNIRFFRAAARIQKRDFSEPKELRLIFG